MPSKLNESDYFRLGLRELIYQGYKLPGGKRTLMDDVREEYGGDDNKNTIYFAFVENKVVGSLVLSRWNNDKTQRFWESVNTFQSEVEYPTNLLIVGVHGIVTHPDFRGRNIGTKLLQTGISDLRPRVVGGKTKTPAAVRARASALSPDYYTIYGSYDVTGNLSLSKTECRMFLDAFTAADGKEINEQGIMYVPNATLTPVNFDTTRFSPEIQSAFERVHRAQDVIGKEKTAVRPLISIRLDITSI